MFKKTIASAVAAGVLATSAVSATAAPMGSARAASPVADSEDYFVSAGNEWLLAVVFALLAIGLVVIIESGEDGVDVLPVSP